MKGPIMEIKNIVTFLKVVSLGSFTKAARELNYVQSTVTTQIQQLESEIGVPLFDRIGKRVFLTSAGRAFLAHAIDISDRYDQIKQLGRSFDKIETDLHIGTIESLLLSTMINALPEYNSHYPNVHVNIEVGQSVDLIVKLKQNLFDFIYISSFPHSMPQLKCYYNRREYIIFVASRECPFKAGEPVTLREVLDEPVFVTEQCGIIYDRLSDLAHSHGLKLRTTFNVGSVEAISRLLQHHRGVSFIPEYAVASELCRNEVAKLDVVDTEPQFYYAQILTHKDKWLSPQMEAFINLLRKLRPA